MNKSVFAILTTSLIFSFAQAAPKISNCMSVDKKVSVTMSAETDDSGFYSMKISSNIPDRPAESSFPVRENTTKNSVVYTLLDSEFEMLTVDTTSGQGKLSNGGFMSPEPHVDVICK